MDMDEILQADIFFFITAIAVVVVGVGLAITLFYLIVILRDVQVVVKKVRTATDELGQDFETLRANIQDGGVRVREIFEQVLAAIARIIPKSRAKRKEKNTEGERA